MNKIIASIFLSLTLNGFSQQLTIDIDSIVIYSLPMNMRTIIGLDDSAVRGFETTIGSRKILNVKSIHSDTELDDFSRINYADDSLLTENNYPMDVRVVIDIYLGHNFISISMDGDGYYRIQNEEYERSRNSELINWLKEFVSDLK